MAIEDWNEIDVWDADGFMGRLLGVNLPKLRLEGLVWFEELCQGGVWVFGEIRDEVFDGFCWEFGDLELDRFLRNGRGHAGQRNVEITGTQELGDIQIYGEGVADGRRGKQRFGRNGRRGDEVV